MNRVRSIGLLLGVVVGLAGCANGPSVGAEPLWFEATGSSGDTVALADFEGDVVVLDFFATWCAPCVLASPYVQRLHERWAEHDNVHVVAVHYDTDYRRGHPTDYAAEHGYTFGVIPDGRAIVSRYGINKLPTILVIGRDGRVINKQTGFDEDDVETFSGIIEVELAE